MPMAQFERISVDPAIMRGVACIKGTRVPVSSIIGMLAQGHSKEEILEGFPDLLSADIDAALAYAAWRLKEQEVTV